MAPNQKNTLAHIFSSFSSFLPCFVAATDIAQPSLAAFFTELKKQNDILLNFSDQRSISYVTEAPTSGSWQAGTIDPS